MKTARVYKFLVRHKKKKPWQFVDASDPRQQAKVTKPMQSIYDGLLIGLLSAQPTLRDVEQMLGQERGLLTRTLVPTPLSDTTLDTEARRLDEPYLHHKLVAQVRDMYRSKMLSPVNMPCGVATVDGKNLATLDHDAGGRAQPRSTQNDKWHPKGSVKGAKPYYLVPVLRAVLTSAEAKPAIAQVALGPHEGESTAFGEMVETLHKAYGRSGMIEIIDADAGLTSLGNADIVNELGYGYVFGLKANQPELFAEAKALLEPMAEKEPPEAQTPWERRNGQWIRRRLWRTDQMRGMVNSVGTSSHLRQTWLVRQQTKGHGGSIEIEDRYFISSELWNHLKPAQILLLVRNHWGIENDSNNSLDLQWHEDHAPWCTQGNAVWGLGLLRIMAYNLVQYLRKRRLRRKGSTGGLAVPMRWRAVFDYVRQAFFAVAPEQYMTMTGV